MVLILKRGMSMKENRKCRGTQNEIMLTHNKLLVMDYSPTAKEWTLRNTTTKRKDIV